MVLKLGIPIYFRMSICIVRNQGMDGQQSSEIKSDQDGTNNNLARISSTVKTLSRRWTSNRGCGHQTHLTRSSSRCYDRQWLIIAMSRQPRHMNMLLQPASIRVIRRSLTVDTAHSRVRALVNSRLDYCNEVLAGMHQYQYDGHV